MKATTLVLCLVALLGCIQFSHAVNGIDMSIWTTAEVDQDTFSCLVSNGYYFSIIEGWNGSYEIPDSLAQAVADAWAGGMAHVDIYIFLCPQCDGNNPPDVAVAKLVDYLNDNGVTYGMLWFDIEQCDGCWYDDLDANANFLATGVQQAQNMGVNVGIYSSYYEWSATVGDFSGFSNLAQWYADWNGNADFSGMSNFGGWNGPSIHQYDDSCPVCFGNLDVSWYPDSEVAQRTNRTNFSSERVRALKASAALN